MRRPTKEQSKIIYIALIITGCLLIFWIFIYGPQSRKFRDIKNKINDTEAQIFQITRITRGKELAEAVKDLNIQLNEISGKFPPLSDDEGVVNKLTTEARRLKIEVKNIRLSDEQPAKSEVLGYDIEELPISMNLVSEYRALGEYLNSLRNDFPILIKVKQLDIKGRGEGYPDLDVVLQVSAYMSKETP